MAAPFYIINTELLWNGYFYAQRIINTKTQKYLKIIYNYYLSPKYTNGILNRNILWSQKSRFLDLRRIDIHAHMEVKKKQKKQLNLPSQRPKIKACRRH